MAQTLPATTKPRLGTGTFWYWNANPTPAGIKRQIRSMKEAGYRGIYIHPMPDSFHKHYFLQGMEIDYLGKKYFQLFKIALEECKKQGLYLMLYDEAGWPSGGVLDRLVRKYPECRARYLQKSPSGGYEEVFDNIPDLMDPRTTEHFIEMVHQRYYEEVGEEFGKTILGIFTDEPFWRALPGSDRVRVADGMPELFESLYGCSFEKEILPYIFGGLPETLERQEARRKYIHVCSLLIKKNYSAVLADWCEKHHIDLEGHFDNEDRFIEIGSFGEITEMLDPLHVPGVDAIWRQIYPDCAAPGNYARFAAAAAIRNKRQEALCECFNVYGYFLTSPVMAYVAGSLLSKGINRLLPMPYLYGDRGKRKVCCSTDLSPRIPLWNAMPALTGFWQWAGDFHTGALQPEVWLLSYTKHPTPDNFEDRLPQNLAAHQEMENIIAKLDDACVFWRFADTTDLAGSVRPKVLILPFPLTDDHHQKLVDAMAAEGVRILHGRDLPDLAEYACIPAVNNPGCRVLPCLRENGEAWMIFNPASVEKVFTFASREPWGELLPPDPVLQECQPMEEKEGIYSITLPPYAIRILQKNIPAAPRLRLAEVSADLQWRITRVEKMAFSLHGASTFRRVPAPAETPASNLYTDLDKEFSGVVTYQAEFHSEKAGTAFIRFDRICHCGSLKVNGKKSGLRAFAPWIFKTTLRKGKNILTLTVSGSGGNEWRRCFREELEPAGYFNGYAARLRKYQVDDAECGISGRVRIFFCE